LSSKINIFWFRRDLRLEDNHGLFEALKSGNNVIPIFIFDTNILEKLQDKQDARVTFIYDTIGSLKDKIQEFGSDLKVFYSKPEFVFEEIIQNYAVEKVFANHDYEPKAIARDQQIQNLLSANNIDFQTFKDHVIFEKSEIVKDDGKPYTVFTPYSKKWKLKWEVQKDTFYTSENETQNYLKTEKEPMPTLESIGFERSNIIFHPKKVSQNIIKNYQENRDFPAKEGTSKLGIHFRFGTISIREKAKKAALISETYLNELIWRDFYAQILFHFPNVEKSSFRREYDNIEWLNNENEFKLWCEGKTGYPIVDAGMRELNATGYMHNRVRMVVASFLTKHLLIDWRWGEAYFAEKLLDFDLASNNGGWQWAAGCGTDAAPYFRIFNPTAQQEKFDKNFEYIKKWIPEFGTNSYPKPIVEHNLARERCLEVYKKGIK